MISCQIFLTILINVLPAMLSSHDFNEKQEDSVQQFVCRICPFQCGNVDLFIVPRTTEPDNVKLYTTSNNTSTQFSNITLHIVSSSKSGIILGFSYYLQNFCKTTLTQFGLTNQNFVIAELSKTISLSTNTLVRFYGNICVYSYSYWWWDWDTWEEHIDWIAFRGFNLVYVPTGVELINKHVFELLGLTTQQIMEFFNGPAYLAWSRMGNMKSFTSPITDEFLQEQLQLQRNITQRLNELGVAVAVPGFAGFVPSDLTKLYDESYFNDVSCWLGFNETFSCLKQIDPTSEFYNFVGRIYMTELLKYVGSNSIYAVDMFNENTPKNYSSVYLRECGKNTVSVLKDADPKAVWLLQGWTFGYDRFWENSKIEAYLDQVKSNDVLILDMFAESNPTWKRTAGFFGKPFLWTLINNFGGNTVMNGNVGQILSDFADAFNKSKFLAGFGYMPEGIYENTILFDAIMQFVTVYVQSVTASDYFVLWKNNVSLYRYNRYDGGLIHDIVDRLYVGNEERYYMSYIIYRRPGFNMTFINNSNVQDNIDAIFRFLEIVNSSTSDQVNSVFIYDFVSVIQNYAEQAFYYHYNQLLDAYKNKNIELFELQSNNMIKIISLLDDISSLIPARSLSCYLQKVKQFAMATNDNSSKLTHDFLLQITLWGSNGEVLDYAFKMWSGVLRNYYLKRWIVFGEQLRISMLNNLPFNKTNYDTEVFAAEKEFVMLKNFAVCNEYESNNIFKIQSLAEQLILMSPFDSQI